MMMPSYARLREDQLNDEIVGLDEKIAEYANPRDANARCVSSYLKQLVRSKREKLAVLRHQRGDYSS